MAVIAADPRGVAFPSASGVSLLTISFRSLFVFCYDNLRHEDCDLHDSSFASIAAISAIIVPPNDDNVASTPSILEFTSAIVTIKYLIQPQ